MLLYTMVSLKDDLTAKPFFRVAASVADAAVVHPNGIKTPLANSLSTFCIQGNSVFNNSPKSLPKNPPDCPFFMQLSF